MNAARCLETMSAAAARAAGCSSSAVRISKTSRTSIWSTRSSLPHRIWWLDRTFSNWPSTVATAWRRRGLCLTPGLGRRLARVRGFGRENGLGHPCALGPLLKASAGRVVNWGGWVGRKSLPPAGAAQVRGRLSGGAGSHRVDHRIVRAVLASRFARCRGQRPSPWALMRQAMRERRRGQIERWCTFAVMRWRNHRSRYRGRR